MQNKISYAILILILLICIMPFSLAIDSFGTYKQKSNINLIQTYNATYCNITSIAAPDSLILFSGQLMTKSGLKFNYTLNSTNTIQLGDYIICGECDTTSWCASLEITTTGNEFSSQVIWVYIFFLICCLALIFISFRIIIKHPFSKDLSNSELYQVKKTNEFLFYGNLIKRKFWIVGLFGVYLSLLLFLGTFAQLIYSIGLSTLAPLINSVSEVMLWGLFPFILFWLVYIIIFFYKSTAEIMRYQFGGFKK